MCTWRNLVTAICLLTLSLPAAGAEHAFVGVVSGDDPGTTLFRVFMERLQPESSDMILDAAPESSGRVRHLYLDLAGAKLGGVRVEKLRVEAVDVQFNPVAEWTRSVEDLIAIASVLQTYAEAVISERDINDDLFRKKVGEQDRSWTDLMLDFRAGGVYARGVYHAQLLFDFDILIELSGRLAIRNGKEIWLEDYAFKVNRLDVPDFMAEEAIGSLQPILDLGRFIFPLRLATLEQDEEKAHLASRVLPAPFEGEIYRFSAK